MNKRWKQIISMLLITILCMGQTVWAAEPTEAETPSQEETLSTAEAMEIIETTSGEKVKEVIRAHGNTGVITEGGHLWMWGFNEDGRLGDGTFESRSIPIQIHIGMAGDESFPFRDVSSKDWYYDAVGYVNQKGLMTGLTKMTLQKKRCSGR